MGFDKLVWQAREIADGVEMTLVSKDGDQGYPGTLTAHVRYTVHHGALRIDYSMFDGQADGGEPDESLLLQSGGRREGTILMTR